MNLNEQVNRIKNLIFELSPQSSGVQELIDVVKDKPELLKHMGFRDLESFLQFVDDSSYEEFSTLRDEVKFFLDRRDKYFQKEMDEFERASQDLSRDEGLEVSVKNMVKAFQRAKEVQLPKEVWNKLENTESNQIKKGEMKKVVALAKQYNKQHPSELKKALLSGEYRRPLIAKFGDRYHLVAGNTRLCTAAALGIRPMVIIADIS
jgi:hypothetical protein